MGQGSQYLEPIFFILQHWFPTQGNQKVEAAWFKQK
jgi:hypothetical protein